jgi:branched-chain amino acid aminotransferase
MSEQPKIYVNGQLVDRAQATISVFDHGFLYGDGIFEGIRVYNGRVFKLRAHLERLYQSAKAILLDIPLSLSDLEQAVLETVRANGLPDAYIRLVVSRGVGDLGLDPLRCKQPTVIIIVEAIQLYPKEVYLNGMELASVVVRRPAPDALNPAMKTLNYLNNILAKIEANQRGLAEVLMLNHEGWVVEATADNVFLVKEGTLWTPPTYVGILNGITRQVVMELAEAAGYAVREVNFTLFEVYNADEVFLTGTAAEMVPVSRCDGRTIGNGAPGPVTRDLTERFKRFARQSGTLVQGSETIQA